MLHLYDLGNKRLSASPYFRLKWRRYILEFVPLNQQLIEHIHAAVGEFCLAITGGGMSAASALFSVAGASASVLEVSMPYHAASLRQYLAARQDQGCTTHTARAMAMAAYLRANTMQTQGPLFGLGCTAAIATNRQRRGTDRCHIAVQSATQTLSWDIEFDKSLTRHQQEASCSELIINAMAQALQLTEDTSNSLAGKAVRQSLDAPLGWCELLSGRRKSTAERSYTGIFPGAFNPLHEGHERMMAVANRMLDSDCALEVSIRNVDKPPLDYLSMAERQDDRYAVVFSNAPTFLEKSAIFPASTFIVGLDTLLRIDEPRYYGSEKDRDDAISTMASRGNRFLVFGRLHDGHFQTLSAVTVSKALRQLCTEVPESEFRVDISSSALRPVS